MMVVRKKPETLREWAAVLDAYEAREIKRARDAKEPFPILDLRPEVCPIPVAILDAIREARSPERKIRLRAQVDDLRKQANKREGLAKMLSERAGAPEDAGKKQYDEAAALREQANTIEKSIEEV